MVQQATTTRLGPARGPRPARLVLADGTVFEGRGFGAAVEAVGEVVFNTSMTGYPELLTDPSYRRQLLTLTCPEIGNYGVAPLDAESDRIQAAGLIVRHLSRKVSNWRSEIDLPTWLSDAGTPGISDIDTRALVRHIRDRGAMMGILSQDPAADLDALVARAAELDGMEGCALADEVSVRTPTSFAEGLLDERGQPIAPLRPPRHHVVCIDLGMKTSIARLLVHHGCKVTIVPARASAASILARGPDGVFLSNGPGDPKTAAHVVDEVKKLLGKVPLFGICMGHQVIAQALGARTYKTKFGHRGGNQPVMGPDGRVAITSQNHGFAVDTESLSGAVQDAFNLSDQTNEGLDAPGLSAFGVQYHPEAAPGPHDARGHFERFVTMMDAFAAGQHTEEVSAP